MKKKTCCEEFRWRYEAPAGMGLNIRVARLIVNSKLEETAFFMTEGYTEGATGVKFCTIEFCPFCGTKLSKFYTGDSNIINSTIEDFTML